MICSHILCAETLKDLIVGFWNSQLQQVVMSFHDCGGNVNDDVCIPLPHWVTEIGRSNPDIYFTDREGRRNPECLSWGIDKERVLRGRTAVEVLEYAISIYSCFWSTFLIIISLLLSLSFFVQLSQQCHGMKYPVNIIIRYGFYYF